MLVPLPDLGNQQQAPCAGGATRSYFQGLPATLYRLGSPATLYRLDSLATLYRPGSPAEIHEQMCNNNFCDAWDPTVHCGNRDGPHLRTTVLMGAPSESIKHAAPPRLPRGRIA